jgi:hypothetical protein
MTRKHPNARRAVALVLFASFLFAAQAGASFHPSPACAGTAGTSAPPRSPLPGDPNTPDEGGRNVVTIRQTTTDVRPSPWITVLLERISHFNFILR